MISNFAKRMTFETGKSLRKRGFSTITNMVAEPLSPVESALKYVGSGILAPLALLGVGWVKVPLNHSTVVQRFGKFESVKSSGLHYVPPVGSSFNEIFMGKRSYKLEKSQIVDDNGNPLIVSAVVNYQVEYPERFLSEILGDDKYIYNQAETSIKNTVGKYPYEADDGSGLKNEGEDIVNEMKSNLQSRIKNTGVKILDVRLTDLNYAPEIASQMLARQQAEAVLKAKSIMVEGSVGLVREISKEIGDEMDKKERDKMLRGITISLVSGQSAQPIVSLD